MSTCSLDFVDMCVSCLGGGERPSNLVGAYAHKLANLTLERRISQMESKMDEMFTVFSTFVNS